MRAFGNARSTRDSFSSHDPSAPGAPAYVPGDGPYAHMPHNLSPFVGSGWGRDAASHVEVAATVSIPHRKVGLIIGRGGENIRFLQQQTRAHIQIQSEHDMCPGQPERTVYLRGARESCAEAARMIQVRHHRASSPLSSRPPFASSRRLRLLKKKVLSPSRTFRISSTECFASGPPRSFPRSLPSRPTATTPATPPATNEPPRWEAPTRSRRRRIIPRGTQPDKAKATAASSGTPPQTRWGRELTSSHSPGATAWAAAGSAARPPPRQRRRRRRRRRPEPPTAAGSGYVSDRRAATAAAAAAAAYPTAYPVAPVPAPVPAPAPAYDYNVAAYGPMAGSMNAMGGMGGMNPYAGQADPYAMGSDPSGAYAAAACAAYFANVPLHAAHAQIRAMGYADPAATMQYWQQCLDCYSRGYPAMPGYSSGGGYPGVAAPPRGALGTLGAIGTLGRRHASARVRPGAA